METLRYLGYLCLAILGVIAMLAVLLAAMPSNKVPVALLVAISVGGLVVAVWSFRKIVRDHLRWVRGMRQSILDPENTLLRWTADDGEVVLAPLGFVRWRETVLFLVPGRVTLQDVAWAPPILSFTLRSEHPSRTGRRVAWRDVKLEVPVALHDRVPEVLPVLRREEAS